MNMIVTVFRTSADGVGVNAFAQFEQNRASSVLSRPQREHVITGRVYSGITLFE
jgi:hypothetical protein